MHCSNKNHFLEHDSLLSCYEVVACNIIKTSNLDYSIFESGTIWHVCVSSNEWTIFGIIRMEFINIYYQFYLFFPASWNTVCVSMYSKWMRDILWLEQCEYCCCIIYLMALLSRCDAEIFLWKKKIHQNECQLKILIISQWVIIISLKKSWRLFMVKKIKIFCRHYPIMEKIFNYLVYDCFYFK